MLFLISIGLWDEKDMSLKAVEAAKKCDILYAEFYTNRTETDARKLEKTIGKEITELRREDIEDDMEKILKNARLKDVGILVSGDALTATTHITLLLEAKKLGIKYKVIHGSSILTAVAETGLQLYKFGRTATLTRNFEESILETIKENQKAGLHTLLLLDIGLSGKEGLEILSGKIQEEMKVIVACQLGSQEPVIRYGKIKDLIKNKKLNKYPAVIIIPGKLHFLEEEFLEMLK